MVITNKFDDLGECWMSDEHYSTIPQMVSRYNEQSCLLEIGTWRGRSAILILQSNPKIKLHCLDNFEREEDLNIFLSNAKRYGVRDRIVLIKDFSYNVSKYFSNNSLDFVYLDGCHDTKVVNNDLKELFPLMKKCGLILGDDWNQERVAKAVQLQSNYKIVWSKEFIYLLSKYDHISMI